jgi:(p)ppGpp synthase/HD superfamily hydrolase
MAAGRDLVLGGCIVPMPQKWACRACGYWWPMPDEAFEGELVGRALDFMYRAHADQKRKADNTPYEEHPVEVAHTLFEAGFGEEVVAAGLLHDVVEDTDVTLEEIAERFGGDVATLVDALTHDPDIKSYNERKASHRRKVEAAGMPAAAIYAADKLANIRALRAAYRAQGEAVGEHFNAPLGVKIEHWLDDVEMLRSVAGGIPFLRDLELELMRFRADRLIGGSPSGESRTDR